jgi:hypothetical protein
VTLYTVEWLVNRSDAAGSGSGLLRHPGMCLEWLRKTVNTSDSIVDGQPEIRTRHFATEVAVWVCFVAWQNIYFFTIVFVHRLRYIGITDDTLKAIVRDLVQKPVQQREGPLQHHIADITTADLIMLRTSCCTCFIMLHRTELSVFYIVSWKTALNKVISSFSCMPLNVISLQSYVQFFLCLYI